MNRQDFRNFQKVAGVRVGQSAYHPVDDPNDEGPCAFGDEGACPTCGSTALSDMECEDCGTDFKAINVGAKSFLGRMREGLS